MSGWRKMAVIAVLISAVLFSCRKNLKPVIPDPTDSETHDTTPGGNNPNDTIPVVPDPLAYQQKAVFADVNTNCAGYYEALPAGYDTTGIDYPLLIFVHGGGELGNGVSDLPLVLKHAIPRMLNEKRFPPSFTVNGETFSFVIVSPQFKIWPTPNDMQSLLDYAKSHYRINNARIYISGLSMGGGATWEFAAKSGSSIAAIVPISGASWADSAAAKRIALADVPAWAFHNRDDSSVTVNSTIRYVNIINSWHPDPLVRMTLWDTGGHDAWTKATDPAYKEDNKNMYEWMLQFTR
ncbi:MAG: hypothetical protein ABI687_12000 [Flavitalea sp.]